MTDTSMFERHLTNEQMAEIAADEWRAMCRDYFARIGHGVAIGNVAYPMVRRAIDDALGGRADKLIAEKAIEVINGLTAYTIFHPPSVYDNNTSESWKLAQRIVAENKDILHDRIVHHMHNLSKSDAIEIIKSGKITIETGGRE